MRIACKATKGRGKRWKRGTTSNSNPSSNRHRLRAKHSDASQPKSDQNQLSLTEHVMEHYNHYNHYNHANQFEKMNLNDTQLMDDSRSIGNESNQSFASVWSNCTNVSFNRFLNGFNGSSAHHKDMLAILSAVTDTIRQNNGKETETEYFGTLMVTLESCMSDEKLTATVCLIQMVCSRLSPTIIRLKFSDSCCVFLEYLLKYINSDNGLLVRSLCNCIGIFLQHQEYAVWQLSSTHKIFDTLLILTVHNKPRIRKTAHKVVVKILKSNTSYESSVCHPIAKLTADFCLRKLDEIGVNDNIVITLHIFGLMKDILPVIPQTSIQKCCEKVLSLMTLGNVLIISTAFKMLCTLFAAKPHHELLSSDLNAKLISALYDYKPNINDTQLLNAWLMTIKEAFVNLYRINKKLCFNHLPKLFNETFGCWLSNSKQIHISVSIALKDIYTNCIEPSFAEIDKQIIKSIYKCLENALEYQYSDALSHSLSVVTHFFNEEFSDSCNNILLKLADIRENYNTTLNGEIDFAFGRAVRVFGPQFVIAICPFRFNEENCDFSNNWLLPILKNNVRQTKLSDFYRIFRALEMKLRDQINLLESDADLAKAKICSLLVSQIWSIFPSFCIKPTDINIAFKDYAQSLGHIISSNNSVRSYVLSGLRNLLKDAENHSELKRFAKNFIPILLNVYTTKPQTDKEKNGLFLVYETLGLYFAISDNNLLQDKYTVLRKRYQENLENEFLRNSLLELLRLFVPYINLHDIEEIYTFILIPSLNDQKIRIHQKKTYRLLEEICKCETKVCVEFFNNNFLHIKNVLVETFSKALPSSKACSLGILAIIIEKESKMPKTDMRMLCVKILPLVFDCLVVNSQKAKSSALKFIVSLSRLFYSNVTESHVKFIEFLLSYLNNSEYETFNILMALNCLYAEFGGEITESAKKILLENVISLVLADNRQTIQESINFLKLYLKSASLVQLSPYLETLINNLTNIPLQHKNHFRLKVKEIFIRLIRKYGYVMIAKMVPESYSKVLKNIRKIEERKKRNINVESDNNDSDDKTKKTKEIDDILKDSSDEEYEQNYDKKSINSAKSAWIKENISEDNDILDLLSSKANQNILSSNPVVKRSSISKSKEFAINDDGKLIIEDLYENKGKKRAIEEESDTEMRCEDDQQSNLTKLSTKSKSSRYEHGGKGIHRQVNNKEWGQEYRSTKADGDMKRKGKPDPYAYIPMDFKALNRRKKAKLSGQFNNIVRSARKGAIKGSNKKFKRTRN